MKDNFSTQSDKYAKYRPSYPGSLFKYLLTLVPDNTHAWDCGTDVKHYQKKNGQNPVAIIYPGLSKAWPDAETRTGSFPILLRIAKILKQ